MIIDIILIHILDVSRIYDLMGNSPIIPYKGAPIPDHIIPYSKLLSMSNETLFNLLLPHLSIDVVYRLYPFSKDLRRMVDNRFYWLKLIERDLKVVPNFEINPKLYYLRLMNYPIGGRLSLIDDSPTKRRPMKEGVVHVSTFRATKIFPDIVYFDYLPKLKTNIILYRDGTIEIDERRISTPEKIKCVRRLFRDYLIAYSGRVYGIELIYNKDPILVEMVHLGNDVSDLGTGVSTNDMLVVTHSGQLKHRSRQGFQLVQTAPTRIIQLYYNSVIDEDGHVYIIRVVNSSILCQKYLTNTQLLLPFTPPSSSPWIALSGRKGTSLFDVVKGVKLPEIIPDPRFIDSIYNYAPCQTLPDELSRIIDKTNGITDQSIIECHYNSESQVVLRIV